MNPDNVDNPQPLVMTLEDMGIEGSIEEDMFPAAVKAMSMGETIYGYPTLLCGNLVTSIGPVTTDRCPINKGTAPLDEYKNALRECKHNFITDASSFNTLLIGKMNEGGWYLPYIYLDGYIDRHGESSLQQAIEELENNIVDEDLCHELNWFLNLCNDQTTNENKCKDGSVSSSEAQESIVNKESVLMFSFSEKLAEVLKRVVDVSRDPQALASVPLGHRNILLQFTDGLVVSKERWMAHNEEKRDAITKFMQFFASPSFRYKIAYGVDLNKPQVRYLLMPNKDFYKFPSPAAYDPIYRDASQFLKYAVPAPALEDKEAIHSLLLEKCVTFESDAGTRRDIPRRKSEL